MKRSLNNLLRGMGSLFDLWPAPPKRYQRHYRIKSDDAAVREAFKDVGESISLSIGEIEIEVRGERTDRSREVGGSETAGGDHFIHRSSAGTSRGRISAGGVPARNVLQL